MAHLMGDEDVFSKSGNYSAPASRLQAQSSGSLPAEIHSRDLGILTVARSRRPLSHNDLPTALQGILDNTSIYHGSSRFFGRSNESGFFSDSPASSNSSLYQSTNGLIERATIEDAGAGLPEPFELDYFNKNKLGSLFHEFAEELGGCWKESGRYLLRKECSVENIDADYSKVSEKAYQVLLKWKNENGAAASVLDLFKCFNYIGREDVAEKVLDYLPKRIQNECQMILLSSPKKIRCALMTTAIHNVKETFKDMSVVKQLRVASDEEIYLCVSKISGKKYILIKIEETPNSFIVAARQAIPGKLLVAKKRHLRNTYDFLKEIKAKEDTVNRLKEIVEQLQSKLKKDYFGFCKESLDCTNCEKTKTKLELLNKESSLLHHTLDKMLSDDRKLSVTGIPTDKIFNLAERTYGICDDHNKMHSEIKMVKRRCSQEILDFEPKLEQEKGEGEEDNPEVDDTLECTMNIIQHFARRRKVVQSLTPKRRKESKAVQRNKSDKSKSRSRFYVSIRDSFKYKNRSTTPATPSGLTRTDSKKTKGSFRSKGSKMITRKKGCIAKPDLPFHPSTSTSPAALVCKKGNKTDFLGPEDLDLDDPNEAYSLSFRAINASGQAQSSRGATSHYSSSTIKSTHKKIHKCNSDPHLRTESRNMNQERDGHGEAVIDIVTRQFCERGRSQSDVQTRNKKPSRDQSVLKPLLKRDKFLEKSQSHCLQDSPRHIPSTKRDQSSTESQSATSGASLSDKSSDKLDRSSNENQSHSLEDSPSVKPSKTRDQLNSQSQSSMSSDNNSQRETTSSEDVRWLKDVDTEDIIFV